MNSRRNISNGVRFHVLKRDNFTCIYCGRNSQEVRLAVDHIIPVKQIQIDDLDNLATSCYDCNLGKSSRMILKDIDLSQPIDDIIYELWLIKRDIRFRLFLKKMLNLVYLKYKVIPTIDMEELKTYALGVSRCDLKILLEDAIIQSETYEVFFENFMNELKSNNQNFLI
jgi:hypothetical protein